MTRCARYDPVALFSFALRERDWVLADLIAKRLVDRPATLPRMRAEVAETARARAGPSTLSELSGWAQLSRSLGIGDGEDAGDEEDGEDAGEEEDRYEGDDPG